MKIPLRFSVLMLSSLLCTSLAVGFQVYGEIGKHWNSLGGAKGFLGNPLNDETGTPDGVGRYNHFQGGSIYWTPQTGAHEVHGLIRDKWSSLGWERSFLGYPLTDESPTPDRVGRYNHFQGGSIYWTPQTGAHEVHGAIRDKWANMGWERGLLGYPTSDEHQSGTFRRSDFQHGAIQWSAATGAQIMQATPIDGPSNQNCAFCNDGSCQCGSGTADQLCASHKGNNPNIGCSQN